MYVPERKLFCHVLKCGVDGKMQTAGISHRYTMMTLLGLYRLEQAGQENQIPMQPVLDALLDDLGWISFAGDLGLLLWLCAVVCPNRVKDIAKSIDIVMTLQKYSDARVRSTTELAWLLAGLAHVKEIGIELFPGAEGFAEEINRLLSANQGPTGIFGHLHANSSIKGRLRGSIGSFADQVYPIYALAHYGAAYGNKEAIFQARKCAEAIVRLQGPQGEWWWHYDAASGVVTRPYPVYSVHQDGMAPMALLALSAVAKELDFNRPILRGIGWIGGDSLLGKDMRDFERKLIWRSIALGSARPQVQELTFLLCGYTGRNATPNPHIVAECRPYELGWALYALCGYKY